MKIIRSTDFQLNNDTAVAIGKFDGIHRGHRELLDRIIAKKAEGLEASVLKSNNLKLGTKWKKK